MKSYKWLAKDENLTVLLVSQLNRELERRINKRPQLSDLAELRDQFLIVIGFWHHNHRIFERSHSRHSARCNPTAEWAEFEHCAELTEKPECTCVRDFYRFHGG